MDQTAQPSGIAAALQNVLTKGLDAATAYYSTQLRVNDPTPSVTGPNGTRVAVGQSSLLAPGAAGVPVWVWIAGAVVLGVAVVVPLLRR